MNKRASSYLLHQPLYRLFLQRPDAGRVSVESVWEWQCCFRFFCLFYTKSVSALMMVMILTQCYKPQQYISSYLNLLCCFTSSAVTKYSCNNAQRLPDETCLCDDRYIFYYSSSVLVWFLTGDWMRFSWVQRLNTTVHEQRNTGSVLQSWSVRLNIRLK